MAIEILVGDGHIFFGCQPVKLCLHSQADFIQRGMIQLLNDGDFNGLRIGFSGGSAAGEQAHNKKRGKKNAKQLFHKNNSFYK